MREEVVQAEADVVRQQQVVEELEKRLRVLHMQQAHYLYGNRQRLIERHLAKLPEPPYDPEVTDVTRASHLAPCPDCGIAYWLHPHAKEPTTTCGYDEPTPFLCLACDGRRLKL